MRAYVSISAHGFGHLAQVAPVVLALQRRLPRLEIIVRSALPQSTIETALPNVEIEPCGHDFGIPMHGIHFASEDEIFSVWESQRARADLILDQITSRLQIKRIDFVVSGVSPWPLAAANALGIPCFGVGSFTWSGILRQIVRGSPALHAVTNTLDDAYAKASILFSLAPGIDMDPLDAISAPGTIVRRGRSRRSEILQITGRAPNAKIVVFAFGGMLPLQTPELGPDSHSMLLLTPQSWANNGFGAAADHLPVPFLDVLASADVIVAKAGYGIATEIAAVGTPSILVQRADWPEDQPIANWLRQYSDCSMIASMKDVTASLLKNKLTAARNSSPPIGGAEEFIADRILQKVLGSALR